MGAPYRSATFRWDKWTSDQSTTTGTWQSRSLMKFKGLIRRSSNDMHLNYTAVCRLSNITFLDVLRKQWTSNFESIFLSRTQSDYTYLITKRTEVPFNSYFRFTWITSHVQSIFNPVGRTGSKNSSTHRNVRKMDEKVSVSWNASCPSWSRAQASRSLNVFCRVAISIFFIYLCATAFLLSLWLAARTGTLAQVLVLRLHCNRKCLKKL